MYQVISTDQDCYWFILLTSSVSLESGNFTFYSYKHIPNACMNNLQCNQKLCGVLSGRYLNFTHSLNIPKSYLVRTNFPCYGIPKTLRLLRGHPGVQQHYEATWTILPIQMCYIRGQRGFITKGRNTPLRPLVVPLIICMKCNCTEFLVSLYCFFL